MAETADRRPILIWFRRDLRTSDHPALAAAARTGRPVVPVYVLDPETEALGSAHRWRLEAGLRVFAGALAERGSRLILRRGPALACLRGLVQETGAGAVWWTRLYDPDAVARDTDVKAGLKADGVEARSFAGHLLFEPWDVATKTGDFYKVYTPMWRAVKDREIAEPEAAPGALPAPERWPESERLEAWALGGAMNRGADVLARHVPVGEASATGRLGDFVAGAIAEYDRRRDIPGEDGTSRLSAHLALGEIGPRTCWHAGLRALHTGKGGAETFLKELVWREFAYHLLYHTPHIVADAWRPEWAAFPWNTDEDTRDVRAWQRGRTGIRFVDAAMREMHVTGTMHNRGRMIVASYLTKHLMSHWRIGLDWFAEHLVDWDPASNALGWQWSAGSGPDATPYFRVFNPITQLDKFDTHRRYVDTWIAEGKRNPAPEALDFFAAIPRRWNMAPGDPYPEPVVGPEEGRKRALAAYADRGF